MKIINKVEDNIFGEICCFADEDGNPMFWGKRIKMKFLSKKEQDIIIGLDLYCFDKDFNTRWSTEKVESIKKNINKQYGVFMEDCKNIDDIFIKVFNEDKDEWDIKEKIKKSNDIYAKVKVIKVDIVKEAYVINFSLNGEEWSIIKSCRDGEETYFYINPTEEAPIVEMEY